MADNDTIYDQAKDSEAQAAREAKQREAALAEAQRNEKDKGDGEGGVLDPNTTGRRIPEEVAAHRGIEDGIVERHGGFGARDDTRSVAGVAQDLALYALSNQRFMRLCAATGRGVHEVGLMGPGDQVRGRMVLIDVDSLEKHLFIDCKIEEGVWANARNFLPELVAGDIKENMKPRKLEKLEAARR